MLDGSNPLPRQALDETPTSPAARYVELPLGALGSLDDASTEFVDDAARHLIGFEIEVRQLAGKRFLSQQRTPADRESLVRRLSLEQSGAARDVGALIVP